jgi:hypothetical protein
MPALGSSSVQIRQLKRADEHFVELSDVPADCPEQ